MDTEITNDDTLKLMFIARIFYNVKFKLIFLKHAKFFTTIEHHTFNFYFAVSNY